jgi:hypothetical protein
MEWARIVNYGGKKLTAGCVHYASNRNGLKQGGRDILDSSNKKPSFLFSILKHFQLRTLMNTAQGFRLIVYLTGQYSSITHSPN